jgi:hypothetical protein
MVERKSLWERVLGFTSKVWRGNGKDVWYFILIQNLCHEEVYQPHDEKKWRWIHPVNWRRNFSGIKFQKTELGIKIDKKFWQQINWPRLPIYNKPKSNHYDWQMEISN